jgi:threonine dehydratase
LSSRSKLNARIEAVRPAVSEVARETPVLRSYLLSERYGTDVLLKAECLQRTGSFKVRGATAKLSSLPEPPVAMVTGSAGNHAQAVAFAARAQGIGCRVCMPRGAPVSKVAAVEELGAEVELVDGPVDDCLERARELADADDSHVFVHPFDDPDVVAGQGTVGLELIEQVGDLERVIVPIGGGGLASGIAIAVKSRRASVRVIGVQAEACAPFPASLAAGEARSVEAQPTIADGIALKRPGELTLGLVGEWVDEIVMVSEDEIAAAIVFLLEKSKLLVEGAGAVGFAALLSERVDITGPGSTAVVLSGGNIDPALLASLVRRTETERGRRLRLYSSVPDVPGGMVAFLRHIAELDGNLVSVEHVREGVPLGVQETGVVVTVETRGRQHAARVIQALSEAGYGVELYSEAPPRGG